MEKSTITKVKGGVCVASGFVAAAAHAGIKPGNADRDDLAVIACQTTAVAAATFTTNRVQAAPVLVSKNHITSRSTKAVVLNSGNANACTGRQGMDDAESMTEEVALALNVFPSQVLVCSTGRIGVPMPMDKIRSTIPSVVGQLSRSGGRAAARAIMTSDSVSKEAARRVTTASGITFSVGGMAKGAGMIDPTMATMLCLITTDFSIKKPALQKALKAAVNQSFNRITVDGDMSTNDTVILLSSGVVEAPDAIDAFQDALDSVALELATKIVLDGEGVSRFIEVTVRNAKSAADAKRAADAIAKSQLVKCAWAGGDPNWGRILDAAGYSGAIFNPDFVDIDYDTVPAVRGGMPASTSMTALRKVAAKKRFAVVVDLHAGNQAYSVLTTDLTEDYVRFNLGE